MLGKGDLLGSAADRKRIAAICNLDTQRFLEIGDIGVMLAVEVRQK